ncbi:MAG: thiamine diphosphokinase [Ruminococcaceae bacterium]|nr:thiamine diphosphokinase [Oscillospiraceae bacterium]
MNILIISAGNHHNPDKLAEYANASDYIICADAGYDHAKASGIIPDILVGDFDSLAEEPADCLKKVKLPVEKDETDTLYALRFAFSKGAKNIVLYGGIGTRFDHSYANICLLQHAMVRDVSMVVTDGATEIYLTDSKVTLKGKKGKTLSVYAFSDTCEGVTLKGFYYPLENAFLDKYDIIGTSNIVTDDVAEISVSEGNLLIVCNQ